MSLNVRLVYCWTGSVIHWRLLNARQNFRMAYSSSNYICSATHRVDPNRPFGVVVKETSVSFFIPGINMHASLIWTVSGCDSSGLPLDLTLKSDSSISTQIRLLFFFTTCKLLCFLLLCIFKSSIKVASLDKHSFFFHFTKVYIYFFVMLWIKDEEDAKLFNYYYYCWELWYF